MDNAALRVAVVGAGPSGFYAAEALLKERPEATVDLFERLPAPYGLVRYGVAPDHLKIKTVTKVFDRLLADPRVRLRANVEVGRDITLDELRRHYHASVFTYGAALDRALGIPGEELTGSMSATDFVAWYNGHPDFTDLKPPLDSHTVVVVGVGNVAVDVTRILAKNQGELHSSDIAAHALAALKDSSVRDVIVIGRRGPAEAKWTTKELRELGELEEADLVIDPRDLDILPESLAAIEGDATAKRNLDVLRELANKPLRGLPRRIHLRFLLSPVRLEAAADGTRVAAVVCERNRLEVRSDGAIAAVGTGEHERIEAQWVLRSVGYRGAGLPGLPFDARKGVVPNDQGRVLESVGGAPVPGLYVAGWIKRGPTGVIGTNKACAVESVQSLLADPLPTLASGDASPESVDALLATRQLQVVDAAGWGRIDAVETVTGAQSGRPRVKLVHVPELLKAAQG